MSGRPPPASGSRDARSAHGVDPAPARRAHTRMLVLQPTSFCNIACDYCYLPQRDRRNRMAPAVLRQALQRLVDDGLAGPVLTVLWHAGEPLVLPPAWYEDAFGIVAQVLGPGCRVRHAMQTNATRIDEAWCRLFLAHGVRIGVSVDGPAALHDTHRRTRDGRGTHALAMRGIELMRAHGVPMHAIAVVTRATLESPDAFCDFFDQLGIREVGCNFDEAEGVHRVSSLAGHEAAHGAFLARLLERSIASGGRVVWRELAGALRRIAVPPEAGTACARNDQTLPLALVSVGCDGDFGTFSPELLGQHAPGYGDFVLGNVARDGYRQALERAPGRRLQLAIEAGVAACRERCAYFDLCGGGAPANKWFENGAFESTETLYCRSMVQRPVEVVLRRLERDRAAMPATGLANPRGVPA